MTNKKTTKRALVMSLVSLFLCFTMLLGTTYAWFTDSVTSTGNKIMAGTLDIQLFMHTETGAVEITDTSAPIFGPGSLAQNNAAETLWEPGKTQVVYFSIKNYGSLDLKYKVDLIVTAIEKNLNEALVYTITPDAQYGSINADNWDDAGVKQVVSGINAQSPEEGVALASGAEHFFALSVHMIEEAGNEYQNGSITFDMVVLASQLASEADSFGNDYDVKAEFPKTGYGDGNLESMGGYVEFALYNKEPDNHNKQKVANVKVYRDSVADPEQDVSSTLVESPELYGGITVLDDQTAQTYDVSVTNLKEGNTTPVEYSIRIGEDRTGVKVYHYDELITSYYDGEYVNFSVTEFSPFTVVWDTVPVEKDESTLDTTRPQAIVEQLAEVPVIEWNNIGGYYPAAENAQQLDVVYKFTAPHTTETVVNSTYEKWHCDYYVMLKSSTLSTLPGGSITLGGNYGSFKWVGFDNPDNTPVNEWIPLLGSVIEGSAWTYGDIVNFVGEFLCGVGVAKGNTADLSDAQFIVQLRLTNPDDEEDIVVASEIVHNFGN
ncbi:MAG: SipW-dependent-type signal peptide-containing protein [Clostridia bacterium]|nr:SipW-dependent-type signal peptide-containing protein [Clostridia bacterium]